MSKISNLIFKNAKHTITSKYGKRNVIQTSAGATSSFHRGTDYGTYGKKLPQYAIENGTVYSCGTSASDGAKYVTVKYPRINKRFVHWHLDSIKVKKGQAVTKGTLLGYTGKTGKATGIHLHLGIIDLKTNNYIDPEVYAKEYKEGTTTTKPTTSTIVIKGFFPQKGYFGFGDTHANVGKIASFMYKTFPAYTKKEALGNYYGKNIQASIKEFQKRTKLEADGNVGPITLKELKKYGFRE
jgi:murein DD-endopeptidase MepM/ murein hydrolase activator NlpD